MFLPRALFALACAAVALPAAAQEGDWALQGNDPVAYFDEGSAESGRSDIMLEWRGKIYHFQSEDNLMRFESNPRNYAPQFGGLCVVALSEGREVPGDPDIFVIHDGRLYLMRDPAARSQFLSSTEAIIAAARDQRARK